MEPYKCLNINIGDLDQTSCWLQCHEPVFRLNVYNFNILLAQSGPGQRTHTIQIHILLIDFLKAIKNLQKDLDTFTYWGICIIQELRNFDEAKVTLLVLLSSHYAQIVWMLRNFIQPEISWRTTFYFIFVIFGSECLYSSHTRVYFLNNARSTESSPCFFFF